MAEGRRFIRHPTDVPIEYSVQDAGGARHRRRMKNVSHGGLCFIADHDVPPGAMIDLSLPVDVAAFRAEGEVAWCRPVDGHFEIGIRFKDEASDFAVRMVEQICQIERYRAEVARSEGRSLTSEEAAAEWIERYAQDFP